MKQASFVRAELIGRQTIASLITERLRDARDEAIGQWNSGRTVRSVIIDDLLPGDMAHRISAAFPPVSAMSAKSSIRERKHVAAQLDRYDPLVEEAVFAFQDPAVMALIAEMTGIEAMEPDAELYAGGISAMGKGDYLRPHLDNSHHADRERYRVLNLLYYTTPDWAESDGGSLQLWDDGPRGTPRTIWSRFNRLVLMATDRHSWHSVNNVIGEGVRHCVSNYYFSPLAPDAQPYFHATSFRAEHGTGLADLAMRADNSLRTAVLKLTGDALYRNPHRYNRPKTKQPDAFDADDQRA